MDKIREWLKGKKTYFVATISVLGTVIAWAEGGVELAEAIKLIVAAILAATIRAGIDTAAAGNGNGSAE